MMCIAKKVGFLRYIDGDRLTVQIDVLVTTWFDSSFILETC